MLDKNDKIHKRSIKKIDAIVTGMLLGWVVASIYGIKKTSRHFSEKKKQEEETEQKPSRIKKMLKMLVFGYKEPEIEKKRWFFSRLFKK